MKNRQMAAAVVAATMVLASGQALAAGKAGDSYFGVQYAALEYKDDGLNADFEPGTLMFRIGHYFTDYIGLEARRGIALNDDTQSVGGVDVSVELENFTGVYGLGRLPMGSVAAIYGMAGWGQGEVKGESLGVTDTARETGLTYGGGVEFYFGETVSVNAEYVVYPDGPGFEATSVNAGVNFNF